MSNDERLSVYLLTFNSERRLEEVLTSATKVADELVIIDSGSTDDTLEICARFNARIFYRVLDNFRDQRVFAEDCCSYNWVLALDSDEALSDELASTIVKLKGRSFSTESGKAVDGYAIRREWFFMGKRVRTFYPVRTPEYIVRLFNKHTINHKSTELIVHEQPNTRGATITRIETPINHYSCDTVEELYDKIGLYTTLAANEMSLNGTRATRVRINLYPWLIWFRWYVLYGGWKDAEHGKILGKYVRDTIYLKYLKLRYLKSVRETKE